MTMIQRVVVLLLWIQVSGASRRGARASNHALLRTAKQSLDNEVEDDERRPMTMFEQTNEIFEEEDAFWGRLLLENDEGRHLKALLLTTSLSLRSPYPTASPTARTVSTPNPTTMAPMTPDPTTTAPVVSTPVPTTAAPTNPSSTSSPTAFSCADMLWSEEFDDTTSGMLDDQVWNYDLGAGGWGNQELQTYTSDISNVRVEDGTLIITALSSSSSSGSFTSGRVQTQDKLEVLYGNIEARMKIPTGGVGNGLWPAFWMLGGNFREVVWPNCGEVDIMEMGSTDAISEGVVNRRVTSAAHWEFEGNPVFYSEGLDVSMDLNDDEFHVFRIEWTPTLITTFVDEQKIWEFDIGPDCVDCTEFHQPFFILINMAVGGRFTGIFDATGVTAPLPAELVVDYVRVCDNGSTRLSGSVIEPITTYDFDCGVPDECTTSALNNYAGEAKCGDRIKFLMDTNGLSEEDACTQVAEVEFADYCGSCALSCNPPECIDCNKPDTCTTDVLNTNAPPDPTAPTCGDRIRFLINSWGWSEADACNRVAYTEHANECGGCNPIDCNVPATCTEEALAAKSPGLDPSDPSCGDRINFLINSWGFDEVQACNRVASAEFEDQCGSCNPLDCNAPALCTSGVLDTVADGSSATCRDLLMGEISSGSNEIEACYSVSATYAACGSCKPLDCGVPDTCTHFVLDSNTAGIPCRDRISFLINTGMSEVDACTQVASVEFPADCGGCSPQ